MSTRRANGHWDGVILPKAALLVAGYDTRVTLRQLFYRLVSKGLLRNATPEYTQLSKRTADLRRTDEFPALIDRTREIIRRPSWTSPEDALAALKYQYRRDRTEGQPYSIYLGVEKAGIIEQLRLWFGDDLGIPILPLGGYSSESFEREIITHADGYDRPSVLLYAGDLDPEGEDIERNFRRHTDFDEFRKVALTLEQAEQYELPPMPGKPKSSRAAGFIEKYGRLFQIEVDALDPNVLRELFAEAIAEYWDDDAYQAVLEREALEREQLP